MILEDLLGGVGKLILNDPSKWFAVDEVGGSKQLVCLVCFDLTSQPEELVYGAVVNSQALHPGPGLLLGMVEASASTVSALTASASTASSLPLIFVSSNQQLITLF
jgi:hypothetical protein